MEKENGSMAAAIVGGDIIIFCPHRNFNSDADELLEPHF